MHLLKYILIQHILVVCLQNERGDIFVINIDGCKIKVWCLCVSCDVRFYTKKNKKYIIRTYGHRLYFLRQIR